VMSTGWGIVSSFIRASTQGRSSKRFESTTNETEADTSASMDRPLTPARSSGAGEPTFAAQRLAHARWILSGEQRDAEGRVVVKHCNFLALTQLARAWLWLGQPLAPGSTKQEVRSDARPPSSHSEILERRGEFSTGALESRYVAGCVSREPGSERTLPLSTASKCLGPQQRLRHHRKRLRRIHTGRRAVRHTRARSPKWRRELSLAGCRSNSSANSDGTKGTRYVDVVGKDARGNVVEMHQVGRQTKGGIPVSREVKALDDIEGATGVRPQYHPYN
jgi:hypothetical protein